MRSRPALRWLLLIAVLTLVAAACGEDGDGAGAEGEGDEDTATTAAEAEEEEGGGATIIRFAFAPDPVWDYLTDTGTLAQWEEDNNIRIVTSESWDEFTYFAGGHGDIVSIATQETPVLEAETQVKTVSFGKYNAQRSPMYRRAGDPYETIEDVPLGSKVCVSSPVSNTIFWTTYINELHGLDYRVGGGDWELIVNDHFVNPENLLRGDCEVAVIIPEAAAPLLRTGELELMYGGKMPFQLYADIEPSAGEEAHVMSNLFTATEEWFDAHPEEAAAFLELWQTGVELWDANTAEIVSLYPQHFSVEAEEDIEWMIDFMSGPNDWFVESVYLTDEWVAAEEKIWEYQGRLIPENPAHIPPDFEKPRWEVIPEPSG